MLLALALLSQPGCRSDITSSEPAPTSASSNLKHFHATAYSIKGRSASGVHTHRGIVAADPRILPIGTRIHVYDAGKYDGVYVVADTGRKIKGNDIDIYLANNREAKHFGNKRVRIEVLKEGSGTLSHR